MRTVRSLVVALMMVVVLGAGWLIAAPKQAEGLVPASGDHLVGLALPPSGSTDPSSLTWSVKLAEAVISPVWTTILLSLGFGGALFELLHPGFGVAGAVSLVAWVLFFVGHWLAGLAGWGVIMFFLLGIGLLTVEALIPGFGVLGLGGIASVIGSIVMAVGGRPEGLRSLFIALIVVTVLVIALIRQFGRQGLWQRIILSTRLSREEGYQSTPTSLHRLVGAVGKVLSPLRPSGLALIEDQRVSVVSEGEFIPTGVVIRVLRIDAGNIIVGRDTDDFQDTKV